MVDDGYVSGWRAIKPDAHTGSRLVAKLINCIMHDGKRSVAMGVVAAMLKRVAHETGSEYGLGPFCDAIEKLKPQVEVRSKRVGGATYQVPSAVSPKRRQTLAIRWLVEAARARSNRSMGDRLSDEILLALRGEGAAYTKRENVHKMADANRAFAHFG